MSASVAANNPAGPAGPISSAASSAAATRVPWQVKYLLLALIWGSSFLLMKVGLRTMAPLQISALRIFAGTLTLLALLGLTGGRLPRERRVWGHLAVSGVFLTALPFSLFAAGEVRVSSALAGIGNATTPLAAVFFALILLPSDRLSPRKLAAVVIGFIGVVVIMQPWESTGRPDLLGFGMTLVAGACYGLGWTYNRRFLGGADLGGLSMPTALLLVGSALMVPVLLVWWLVSRDTYAAPWSGHVDVDGGGALLPLLCVLALGVVGTGLAYMLQFDVVRGAGATVSTTVTYLIPVVSVLLGVAVLSEHLAWPQLLGAAIVLVSAIVIGLPAKRARATSQA
ncbi:Permease of the drug/metabolite transporter (DMT) superfamily [Pedococcus dokdonensis]|uniref:Permease of the drug/metabolite transporter (DMT) superfamily n=1 Tax=Pedococcus dokdonensis TaxID=443156 RepID=A0A1H0QXX3_9MICO|nr:DMT family transporter [Pedococcus dokdonensis]SDP22070.1 Permease of the drug/metabolite transporter (DMT) superfamily [Pedococcus dokdonensis]